MSIISWKKSSVSTKVYSWATTIRMPLVFLLCYLYFQFSSVAQPLPTLCDAMLQYARPQCPLPTPRIHSNSCPLSPWCHPTISSSVVPLSSHLQSFQHQGLFQWVSSLHQEAQVLQFQLQHQSFNEYSGLISFRMDWLDLLAVQGTLKSLLQHHSSKVSIFRCSSFFIVHFSHPYMTTGKTSSSD